LPGAPTSNHQLRERGYVAMNEKRTAAPMPPSRRRSPSSVARDIGINVSRRVRHARDALNAVAQHAGASLELTFAYYAFHGRLNHADLWRLNRADESVVVFHRDKKTQKLRSNMHLLADHYFAERGIEGAFALTRDAA
jgi:hypothetical protein